MKRILITGSTDGVGKLTAIKLAKEGHEIIVHGRNEEKLNRTISEIIALSKHDRISGVIADFSDFKSVQKMIEQLSNEFPSIDQADENGLLAIGGDLEIPSLVLAYKQGIFPWPIDEQYPLAWFSPDPRGILFYDNL